MKPTTTGPKYSPTGARNPCRILSRSWMRPKTFPWTCCAAIFSSTAKPMRRADPTAMAAKRVWWQEAQAALGMKFASAFWMRGRLPWMAPAMVLSRRGFNWGGGAALLFAPDFNRKATMGGSHGHGGEAVVVAGGAGGLGYEIRVGLLDERKTSLDGTGDGVVQGSLPLI